MQKYCLLFGKSL
jgi:hypothetical protein